MKVDILLMKNAHAPLFKNVLIPLGLSAAADAGTHWFRNNNNDNFKPKNGKSNKNSEILWKFWYIDKS